MKPKILQTDTAFEQAISPHRVQNGLTQEGVEVARKWLRERYKDNRCNQVKRLTTFRAMAYNAPKL